MRSTRTQAPPLLISSDSHVSEPHDLWETRLPKALRDKAPRFRPREEFRPFDHPGAFDPSQRLVEMTTDGVSGEVLYPTLGLTLFKMEDAPLQEACFHAYNEWLKEYCEASTGPVYGIGMVPAYNIDRAIEELEWCHKAGMPGIMLWQVPHPDLPFTSPHYDPLWQAAQDLNMPVSIHILTGVNYSATVRNNDIEASRDSVNRKTNDMMNSVFDFVFTGVLDRFPGLKIVIVEGEIGWMPFILQQWDYYFHRFRKVRNLPIELEPSEYFYRQMHLTFFNDAVGGQLLSSWGVDNCMWSNDYPHGNSPWPNSRDVLQRTIGHLPQDSLRKLVQDNVTNLYGLTLP